MNPISKNLIPKIKALLLIGIAMTPECYADATDPITWGYQRSVEFVDHLSYPTFSLIVRLFLIFIIPTIAIIISFRIGRPNLLIQWLFFILAFIGALQIPIEKFYIQQPVVKFWIAIFTPFVLFFIPGITLFYLFPNPLSRARAIWITHRFVILIMVCYAISILIGKFRG